MKLTRYQGIDNVPQQAWNVVTAGHPFSGWQWCKFDEAIRHPNSAYYVIASSADGTPISGAQFAISPDEFIPTGSRFARRIIEPYLTRKPLVMSRAGAVSGFKGLYLPGDTTLRAEFIQQVTVIGQEIAREHRSSFVVYTFLEDELDEPGWDDEAIRLKDYMARSTRLLIEWDTYEQYLEHLSKKHRKNIRRNVEAADAMGIVIESAAEVTDIDRVEQLIRNVHHQYDVQGHLIVRPILENMHLIPDFVCLNAYYENRLVGSEILTYDQSCGVAAPLAYGRDYAVDYVYFVMYYHEIRLAIEQFGASVLIGDSEAYDAKRRLGFELEKRNNIRFYPMSPISRLLFTLFKNVVD